LGFERKRLAMEQMSTSIKSDSTTSFGLPDHSRVWIYAGHRELTEDESRRVEDALKEFVGRWAAHGASIKAEAKLINKLFLVIVADEEFTKASGCSIDDSVHFVRSLGDELGIDFFNRMITQYEKEGKVYLVKLHEFWAMRKAGLVDGTTIVYNNLITNLGELKSSWRVPFDESWHREMWA
jgi:hypothetical protein